jgi:protoheme IX farnesyltransferase
VTVATSSSPDPVEADVREPAPSGAGSRAESGAGVADYLTLVRPRLNVLTVFAVAAGWWAGAGSLGDPAVFLPAVLGAAFVAGGSSALNQAMEREFDALMTRTADRPVPTGRLTPVRAAVFGAVLSCLGIALLATTTNVLTTGLALLCIVWYLVIYTPLKSRTSLNTLAGTIPGALPPLMGVAAATGEIGNTGWFLFALVVVWQLPHFLSIAWIYRHDYKRAGMVMLPGIEGGPASTARQVIVQTLLLVSISLAATPLGLAGRMYFVTALVAGIAFLAASVSFALQRSDPSARVLLRVSVLYLPAVLTAYALDPGVL